MSTAAMMGLVACGASSTTPMEVDEVPLWQTATVAAMQADRASQNVRYVTGMEDRYFRVGLLLVPRSTEVGLVTNRLDALYFAAAGSARISSDTLDVDLEAGGVVFVRGDVEHRIRDVEDDLELVVVFRIATVTPADPDLVAFTSDEMVEGVSPEESVYAPLLTTSNVGLGMYMVPKGIDVDHLMVHAVPEVKIVAEGTSRFEIGAGGLRADAGTIALIPNGVQHQFRKVAEPLSVLAIWGR